MTKYTPREVEQPQMWAKIQQLDHIIILLTSEKNVLMRRSKVVQKQIEQETLE